MYGVTDPLSRYAKRLTILVSVRIWTHVTLCVVTAYGRTEINSKPEGPPIAVLLLRRNQSPLEAGQVEVKPTDNLKLQRPAVFDVWRVIGRLIGLCMGGWTGDEC